MAGFDYDTLFAMWREWYSEFLKGGFHNTSGKASEICPVKTRDQVFVTKADTLTRATGGDIEVLTLYQHFRNAS